MRRIVPGRDDRGRIGLRMGAGIQTDAELIEQALKLTYPGAKRSDGLEIFAAGRVREDAGQVPAGKCGLGRHVSRHLCELRRVRPRWRTRPQLCSGRARFNRLVRRRGYHRRRNGSGGFRIGSRAAGDTRPVQRNIVDQDRVGPVGCPTTEGDHAK
jgi:hypothetical protein